MVKSVFADTAYFLALNISRDRFHEQALSLEATLRCQLLTTEWVLTEVADALAAPPTRARFAAQIERLRARDDVRIVAAKHRQFERGCALYLKHKDKRWSLTDCISFLVMRQHGADTALTSDRHFVQAGFRILLGSEPSGIAEPAAPSYACRAPAGAEPATVWIGRAA
ncbi:MAG: type II toxin-antitoxin system VapC family toxin [Steroidobacteraceae bacterium]